MTASPIVELKDVHLNLVSQAGQVNILRGMDLTLWPGETVGVVGPSGSGKSTMLMIVAGLERITSGKAEICGADFTALDEDALARIRRDRIGIVFQDFHLIPTMTALENVAIPLEFAGRADAFEVAARELDAVGLGHRLDHYPGQLSGGEQQRVALARSFAPGPDLLLADEPTGNLDGETGTKVMDLLFERHAALGNTLMMITHDPALAKRCDRTVSIKDGLVIDDGMDSKLKAV